MGEITKAQIRAYFPTTKAHRAINICPSYNLVYITNQKAGCSTLKTVLQRLHTADFSPWPNHYPHANGLLPTPLDVGWDRTCNMLSGDAFVFTFVRNPLDRVASAYQDKMVRQGRLFRPEIQRILGRPEDPEAEVSVDEFLSALEAQKPLYMNPHWRPQHLNIMHGLVHYSFIGRLERFDQDFARLKALAGLPDMPVDAINKRGHSDIFDGRPDRIRRVAALYAADFDTFGYSVRRNTLHSIRATFTRIARLKPSLTPSRLSR